MHLITKKKQVTVLQESSVHYCWFRCSIPSKSLFGSPYIPLEQALSSGIWFLLESCRTQKNFAGILPNTLLWFSNSSLSHRTLIFNSSQEFVFRCNFLHSFPAIFRSNHNSSQDMDSEIPEKLSSSLLQFPRRRINL